MGLFKRKQNDGGQTHVPVWFMRQAGRYHQHYQNIKRHSDFMSMCKTPLLAQKITHGPIDEFNFDGAILFSDLLFPLEYLGMGLTYNPGPCLGYRLESLQDIKKLRPVSSARQFFDFQRKALDLLKKSLPSSVSLLGFVGAPFTLYAYAVEGSHKGGLIESKVGLYDGRWNGFTEILYPCLLEEMQIQAEAQADGICLFDTAAGELSLRDYQKFVIPLIRRLTADFHRLHPHTKLIYYSKHTHLSYLQSLECQEIDVLGIDWRMDVGEVLNVLGKDYIIQGNLDPALLHLPWQNLKEHLDELWNRVRNSKKSPDRWICGLGHGVLPKTPEQNVLDTVKYIHKNFYY